MFEVTTGEFRCAGPVCIGGPGPMTAQPNVFDNHYYKEVSHPKDTVNRPTFCFSWPRYCLLTRSFLENWRSLYATC